MLSYFRINDPYRLLGLFLILLVLFLPGFISPSPLTVPELNNMVLGRKVAQGYLLYGHIVDSTPPLAAWMDGLADALFGQSLLARRILAFLLLFLEGGFFGILLINRKAFTESTYIPALIFLLFACYSFDVATFNGTLVGAGFMLFALNILFREIEFGRQRDENVLNVGILIAIASMFDFSYVVFVPGCLVILFLFTRVNLRKHLLFIVGFLLPHAVLWAVYFKMGRADLLWQYFYKANLNSAFTTLISFRSLIYLGILPLAYLLLSALALNRSARVTKYQSQLLQVMFMWLLIAIAQVFMMRNLRPQSFLMLLPPVSFFVTHFLLMIRRRKFAEMNTWIILVGIVLVMQLGRYDRLSGVDYSRLWVRPEAFPVRGEKVLYLGARPAIYLANSPASGFINWSLAEPIFRNPQSIENVTLVYRVMKSDLPGVIVDPGNLMPAFFRKMPEIGYQYRVWEPGIYRKINN